MQIKNKHLFPGNYVQKPKGFEFMNPIAKVIIVVSIILAIFIMLMGGRYPLIGVIMSGVNMFLLAFFIQMYLLLPAYIAWGRGCKYKEFILATTLFLGPMALIWALVGEKENKN